MRSRSVRIKPFEARACGFSLLEALVAASICAIVASVGMPMFGRLLDTQRTSTAMHLLSAHMATARMTAVGRRQPTVLCPAASATTCRTDGDWTHEWLMFVDRDGNQQADVEADVIRRLGAPVHPSLRALSSTARPLARFTPDGRSAGNNLSIRLCRDGALLGTVIVNNGGRVRSERPAAGAAC